MRNELLGYVLDALEPQERKSVEAALAADPQLRQDCALLRRAVRPLSWDEGHLDPPPGLAARTCNKVFAAVARPSHEMQPVGLAPPPLSPSERPASPRRWRLVDLSVAAGIFLAASAVVLPALYQSRVNAGRLACENNLIQAGISLASYQDRHGKLPALERDPDRGVGQIYSTLVSSKVIPDEQMLRCPSETGDPASFKVPAADVYLAATGRRLAELQGQMQRAYRYRFGFQQNGQYFPVSRLADVKGPLMADEICPLESTGPHGCKVNVLFPDGSVRVLAGHCLEPDADDIFVNDRGEVRAGLHPKDVVLGGVADRP